MAMSIDLAGMVSDRDRYRLDGNAREQLEKKTLPALAVFGCIGIVSGNRMGLAVGLAVVIDPVLGSFQDRPRDLGGLAEAAFLAHRTAGGGTPQLYR